MSARTVPRVETGAREDAPPRGGRLRRALAELTLLQRLLLMEAFIFLVAFFGVLGMIRWYAHSLTARIDAERFVIARAFAGEVDYSLRHAFEELEAGAGQLRGTEDASTLDQLVRDDQLAGGALLLAADGTVVASDTAHRSLRSRPLPVDTLPSSQAGGRSTWGVRLPDGEAYVALAVPADAAAPGHRLVGLIPLAHGMVADIFQRAVEVSSTAHADVVDAQGKAMFSTEPEHSLRSSDHPTFYEGRATQPLPDGTYRIDHEGRSGDDRHVMGFVQLESVPWVFGIGATVRDTYAPVRALLTGFYALSAVAGALSVAVTLVGASRLTQPVRALSEAARKVAGGSVETPIAVHSGGEIGELARSVETMRRSLYDWGVTLDQRVIDRTREIEERSLELAASAEVARIAGSTFEIEPVLRQAVDYIERIFDADAVIAYLPARGRRPPIHVSSARARADVEDPGAVDQCAACMLHDGGAVTILTPDDDRLPACLRVPAGRSRVVAMRSPILGDGEQSGALCLLYREENEHAPHRPTVATLQLFASALAFGVRNSDLYQDLRQREAQARLLVGKVLTAQEEERRRVARELHDDTAQALAGLMFGIDALDRLGPDRSDARAEQLASLRTITKDTIDNLRRTIFALRPPALDDLGLEAALMRYADLHARPLGITVTVSGTIDAKSLGPDGEVALFRMIQESLNNIVRHSGATAAQVSLRKHPDGVIEVHVRDNGRGFDVEAARRADAVGIYGMAERAEMLGGHLTVTSRPGEGTVVGIVLPASADYAAT